MPDATPTPEVPAGPASPPPPVADPDSNPPDRKFLKRAFGLLLTDPLFTPAGRPTLFVEGNPFQRAGAPGLELTGRYQWGDGEARQYDGIPDLAGQLGWTPQQVKQFVDEVTNVTNRR